MTMSLVYYINIFLKTNHNETKGEAMENALVYQPLSVFL